MIRHLKKIESRSKDSSSYINNYVDCGESIKAEDIKEEINDEESVEDPLDIQHIEEFDKFNLNSSITSYNILSTNIHICGEYSDKNDTLAAKISLHDNVKDEEFRIC